MERDKLSQEIVDEVFGLGPLEPLLNDGTISDILVNTHSHVYIERRGVLERTEVTFKDDRAPDADHRQDCVCGWAQD